MKYILGLFLAIWVMPLFAQDNFSFFTDRRFFEPHDLIGYQFVPNKMEIPKESKSTLKAGQVSFGITNKNLYVKGEGVKGVYNINNINSTDYGYILNLLDPRNPASKGHLKVILTKGAYADALVFKKDVNEKEIIFVLPDISEKAKISEKAYFTDWGEMMLEFPEDIWGQTIRPFIRITKNPKIQQRLFASDSVKITFEHLITEIDKTKATKEEMLAMIEESTEGKPADVVKEEVVEEKEEMVKVAEESNDSPFFSNPAPKEEEESSSSPFFSSPTVKKEETTNDSPFFTSPKKEEKAVSTEQESDIGEIAEEREVVDLELDPDAVPPIGEEEIKADKIRKGKVKIIENYFIKIKSFVQYDDGTSEIKEDAYPIKKWVERADENAKPGEEKFQIEFQGEKGKVFHLYLTTERTIARFEWNNQNLLVRD